MPSARLRSAKRLRSIFNYDRPKEFDIMTKKDHISERLPYVETYLSERKDVVFAYLFGSYVTGKVHPLSDVDIAVYLDSLETVHSSPFPASPRCGEASERLVNLDISEKRLEILGHLNEIFKTDEVDLVVLNTAPLTLKMKILQSRRVISDNQPFKRHIFESITTRSYLDFSVLEMRLLERRFLYG